MNEMWETLLTLLFLLATSLYFYVKYKFMYWKNVGVTFAQPSLPMGNFNGLGKKYHTSDLMLRFYKELKGKGIFGGVYLFTTPIVIATDLEFIKTVLIKDFNYFKNRGTYFNESDDPLSANLFNIEDEKWQNLRTKLTPTFTSGKMKMMFPSIVGLAENFIKTIDRESKSTNEQIEIKNLLGRYTVDVIGLCAFGIECDALNNPEAEFFKMGKKAFENAPVLRRFIMLNFKNLAKKLRYTMNKEVTDFYMNITKETVNYRESNSIVRNDFLNLLIELKNSKSSKPLTLEQISAQSFVFLLAGYETSSTTLTYCLYELALHTDLQHKARRSALAVLKKFGGNISYGALNEMIYLEQCINESLRKYSPASSLIRETSADYTVPNTNITLKKGTKVLIPVHAIHHDPEYYQNPDVFDPDRFSPEMTSKRNPCLFLPFGSGPRNCIGLRFGIMQAKVALVHLLLNYKMKLSPKTDVPLLTSKSKIVLSPQNDVVLIIEKINSN